MTLFDCEDAFSRRGEGVLDIPQFSGNPRLSIRRSNVPEARIDEKCGLEVMPGV